MDKVLVAEDDPSYRAMIKAAMKKYSDRFEVVLVEDGLEAINVLRKEPISVLVTDLKMPRVEGLVLLAYINKNFPRISCIVMTSVRRPELKEKLKKDILSYIEKPFKADELAHIILGALHPDHPPDGSAIGISVASFLQLIEIEQKSCMCDIVVEDGRKGELYFENGRLYRALFDSLEGKQAVTAMLLTDSATLTFYKPPEIKPEPNFQGEIPSLILEVLRNRQPGSPNP